MPFTETEVAPGALPVTITGEPPAPKRAPFDGLAMVTVGGPPRVTLMLAVPVLPTASTAVALIGFAPAASGSVVENAPSTSGTGNPLIAKLAIGLASATV